MRRILSARGRRRDRNVVMPPTLRYRSTSSSHSRGCKRKSSRLRMRPWLEGLLDREECCILRWENKMMRTFSIAWRHASSHGFDQSQHGDLFYMWAQHTGKLHKNNHGDHSNNKSTFRCALHSLKDCIELTKKGDKRGEGAKRTYQFIDADHHLYDKKRKTASIKRKKAQPVDEKDDCSPETKYPTTDGLDYLSTETNSPASSLSSLSPGVVHNIQQSTTPCNDSDNIKDDSYGASTLSPLTPTSQHMDNSYMNEIPHQEYFQSTFQTLVPVPADGSQLYSETETSAEILIMLQRMNYDNDCVFSGCKQEPITQDIHYENNQYHDVKTMEHHDTREATNSIFLPKLNCGGKVTIQTNEQDSQPDMIDCSFIQALLDQHQQRFPPMDNAFSEEIASDVIIETEELPVECEATDRNFLTLKLGKRVLTEVQPLLLDQSLAAMEAESSFDSLTSFQNHDIFSIGTF